MISHRHDWSRAMWALLADTSILECFVYINKDVILELKSMIPC